MAHSFPNLIHLFDGLQSPTSDVGMGRFCAAVIPGYPSCAVGKDIAGNPVLLIQAEEEVAGLVPPAMLEHLSVIHSVNCRVQDVNREESTKVLSVVRCSLPDRIMQEFFLRSLYPIVAALPRTPSQQQIRIAIDRLVDLFRQFTQAPRKTISGLWAELFLVARCADPESLLNSWHAVPEERFDFSAGNSRVEVKGTSGPLRIHHFSLEQLRPPAGTRVLVASLLVSAAQGGQSIYDLVDIIRQRVHNPELLVRVDALIAQVMGQDWRAVRDQRFDFQLATQSLRFFDAADIPSVVVPLPAEVSSVSFRVDLSQLTLAPSSEFIDSCDIFTSAITDAS